MQHNRQNTVAPKRVRLIAKWNSNGLPEDRNAFVSHYTAQLSICFIIIACVNAVTSNSKMKFNQTNWTFPVRKCVLRCSKFPVDTKRKRNYALTKTGIHEKCEVLLRARPWTWRNYGPSKSRGLQAQRKRDTPSSSVRFIIPVCFIFNHHGTRTLPPWLGGTY
jgi:hypothetical protein